MPRKREDDFAIRMQRATSVLMSMREGRLVLRELLRVTGYHSKITHQDPATGEINSMATMYNLSRRDVWQFLRQFMTPEQEALLEKGEPEPVSKAKKNDDPIEEENE